MCGIFGFAIEKQAQIKAESVRLLLKELIRLSESRGKEAAGLAFRTEDKITVCKEAHRGSEFVGSPRYKAVTEGVLSDETIQNSYVGCTGHTRLVTNGSMEKHENNQPVVSGGIVGIHNGIIVNDTAVFEKFNLERTCDVDTESLLACINLFCKEGDSMRKALVRAYQEIQGTASVALLFQDAPVVLLASNNGSLYMVPTSTGFVFASEHYILAKVIEKFGDVFGMKIEDIVHIRPNTGHVFSLDQSRGESFAFSDVNGGEERRSDVRCTFEDVRCEEQRPLSRVINDFVVDDLRSYRAIFDENVSRIAEIPRCSRCILPRTMPFIEFDSEGVCNFCNNHASQPPLGADVLEQAVAPLRGNGKDPDCLFPLSGGRDSSYGLHYVKEVLKLNPIAYSYDWGMLTDLGRRNQARMCGQLGVEHLLISADIEKKRRFIRGNVEAWLKRPDLGTVPLFMAGDKQYFYYLNRLKKQIGTDLSIYCENPLEQTNFKYGFCNVAPKFDQNHVYKIGLLKKMKLAAYYGKHYLRNPKLLNASLADTIGAFGATYFIPHDYIYLFKHIRWDEQEINSTLINRYDWETAEDTSTTWRIGDGTAPFYNYIYYTVAGFTENDTFRSNQIREGVITREEGLRLAADENQPRFEALRWYGETIGIDILGALDTINGIKKLY